MIKSIWIINFLIMFKISSVSFFKRIILLILFSLSALLIAINNPQPFGGGGAKSSSFEINQQSLHTNPTERQKQAVWTFLQSQENFEEDWKEKYTNWLDLIIQFKPQKTAYHFRINQDVDLRPLWNVNPIADYSNLTLEVKKVLADLSKLTYHQRPLKYKLIFKYTFQYFIFQKETNGAVYKLIETLKNYNRLTKLIQYQIKTIGGVNIEPLLSIQNIASLSANEETYNTFSKSVKVSLRNLLDLDIASSTAFNSSEINFLFSSPTHYDAILTALGTRIDAVILDIKTKTSDFWKFVKRRNRFENIKGRLIPYIGGVDVSSLFYLKEYWLAYHWLNNDVKATLADLLLIPGYDENTIDNFIQYDRDAEAVWVFLQSQDDFEDDWSTTTYSSWIDLIKQRKPQKTAWDGKTSAVVNLVPLWSVDLASEYKNLTPEIKKTLLKLSQLSHSDNNAWDYKNIIKNTLQYFSFGKETNSAVYDLITTLKTSNRWSELKEYQIRMIQDVNIESLWTLTPEQITALTGTESNYNGLATSIKITLRNLLDLDLSESPKADDVTQIFTSSTNYNPILAALATRIDKIINQAKIDVTNVVLWTFLKQNNRLGNIFQLKISQIANVDISVLSLYKINSLTNYANLNSVVKEKLRLLSEISDYRTQIDFEITKNQPDFKVWTFLTTSDRLTKIKQYQINTIDTLQLLPSLSSIFIYTPYDQLTSDQKNFLISLSVISNYNSRINNAIQIAQTAASAAWTFLKTSNRLSNLEKYEIKIIDTLQLLPALASVETLNPYRALSPSDKTLLYNLSKISNYQRKINDAISFAQNTSSAWTFLTIENRLTNIKKYQINTIADVILLPTLVNIGTSNSYIRLSSVQKNSLYTLSQTAQYQQKITEAIQKAQIAASTWDFLRNGNRLKNLKQYQINTIDDIPLLSNLTNVETSTIYAELSSIQKTLLYDLSQTAGYQQKITDAIQKAQIISDVLVFLTTSNRLTNIQQYQIKIIDSVPLLPNLATIETSTRYTDLSSAQKTSLYTLGQKADYQQKVTDVIQNAETVALEVWIFLRKNDRLKNLQKYNINKIETVALLPLWKIDPLSMNYINFLISEHKFTLDRLSKIMKYKAKIDTSIAQAKKQTLALWNYLITTNALKNIQKYEIKNIAKVDISSLKIANVKKTFDQQDDVVQEKIIELKELSDYKLKIQKEIQKTKAIVVWDYLKKSKRLQNIKKYQITMINGMEVAHLKTANMDQDYTEQNEDVKKDLIALSKISSFENQIDQRIENHNTIEDNNDRTLLTMIILLSLFGFLFLTTGTGFYLYKKFWIPRTKK